MYQTLVMLLQNGTQKKKVLVPDFRRDDGTKNNNNEKKVELGPDFRRDNKRGRDDQEVSSQ